VSKERARRRAAREHETAIRAAARAAEAERRERRAARRRTLRRHTTQRLPRLTPVGRPPGALARRRRVQTSLLLALLIALNVVVWVVRPDWPTRLAALVVTVLVAPVLAAVLVPRRR
jgi:Flp pilus assembly protein TadB